jgi:hypothetical protein
VGQRALVAVMERKGKEVTSEKRRLASYETALKFAEANAERLRRLIENS